MIKRLNLNHDYSVANGGIKRWPSVEFHINDYFIGINDELDKVI